jgi:hypothetical protein
MGNQNDNGTSVMAMVDMYRQHAQPVTPFLSDEMVFSNEIEHKSVLNYCIEIAYYLSLHDKRDVVPAHQINDDLLEMLGDDEISLSSAAGILLLILRVDIDESIAKRVGISLHIFA